MEYDCVNIARDKRELAPWRQRLFGKAASSTVPGVAPGCDKDECLPPMGELGDFKSILVPTDFTTCSVQALAEAIRIARQIQAKITLLYVVDVNLNVPPTGPVNSNKLKAELWQEGLSKLGQTVLELASTGVQARTLIRQGVPWEEIVDAAQQHDLVIMGKHSSKPFWLLFSRNTVKGVLEAAPCSVMVVNPKPKVRTSYPVKTNSLNQKPAGEREIKL